MGEKKAEVPVGKELVRMTGIMKEFPGVKALDNVKLDLYAGEVLALLGENGAGKSTLMKILSGVYQRDDGEIILFGNKIGEWDANKSKYASIKMLLPASSSEEPVWQVLLFPCAGYAFQD